MPLREVASWPPELGGPVWTLFLLTLIGGFLVVMLRAGVPEWGRRGNTVVGRCSGENTLGTCGKQEYPNHSLTVLNLLAALENLTDLELNSITSVCIKHAPCLILQ